MTLNQGSTLTSDQIVIARAEGVYLWDVSGKRYLDMFSQTWSMPLGHNNPHVIEAAISQLRMLTHLRTSFATEGVLRLANRIAALAPAALTNVSFVLHGSLAVEGALKLAMNNYQDRTKVIYLEDGFHGRSLATMGISWKSPDCKYSSYFNNAIEAQKDLADIEAKMASDAPAAIIIELVQGNSGFHTLGKDFVSGVRKLSEKYGVTMIVDEVQTAFGCVDTPFFTEQFGIVPDIIVFGKSLGGGLPIAGTISKEHYAFRPGDHSFTFGCSPVSIAAAEAYLEQLLPRLQDANRVNRLLTEHLHRITDKYRMCVRPRTIGLKAAFDIVDDRGMPDPDTAHAIVRKMLERGVITATSRYGNLGNAVMLQPPLIISSEQLAVAFEAFDDVLGSLNRTPFHSNSMVQTREFGGRVLGAVASGFQRHSSSQRLDWQGNFDWASPEPLDPNRSSDSPNPPVSGYTIKRELEAGEVSAISYHPDRSGTDGVQHTILHVERGGLDLLLCTKQLEGLQQVSLQQGDTAYVMAPFGTLARSERTLVRETVPRPIAETVVLKEIDSIDALYVPQQKKFITLGEAFHAGVLGIEVDQAFRDLLGVMRVNGEPIFRYRHCTGDEHEVFYDIDKVWYRFSFVSGRAGYDKDIPRGEMPAPESIRVVEYHRAPESRACPFCVEDMSPELAAEEILFHTSLSMSVEAYAFVLNRNEYAENQLCLIATSKRAQVLCRNKIRDALLYAKALGSDYEGGFNSLGAATVQHYHLSFYKKKSPIWRNLNESLVRVENAQLHGDVVVGDLSSNWTRTRSFTGSDPESLAEAVYMDVADLQKKNIVHTCKFVYHADGTFTWLMSPRKSGYMTHVRHLLDPEGCEPPPLVNTCGSVEAPGGEAILFFAHPRLLSTSQSMRMSRRFKAALDEGSDLDWRAPTRTKTLAPKQAFLFRYQGHTYNGRPGRIAHRVDSPHGAQAAMTRGVDFVEMDVQMTKDGQLIAFWGRIWGRYDVYGLTLSQIEAMVGSKPTRIEELIEFLGDRVGFCFDIKDWSDGTFGYMDAVLKGVLQVIQKYKLNNKSIIESFNLEYLKRASEIAAGYGLDVCTSFAFPNELATKPTLEDIGKASRAGASAVFVYGAHLSPTVIERVRDEGMVVITDHCELSENSIDVVQLVTEEMLDGR